MTAAKPWPLPDHKRCPKCARDLPMTDFSTNPGKRDGHNSYCRPCATAQVRAYRETPEGRLSSVIAARKYRAKNRVRNLALREAAATSTP